MSRLSRMVVAALVTVFFVLVLIPTTLIQTAGRTRSVGQRLWTTVTSSIPPPVLIAALMLVFLVVSFVTIFAIVRLFTSYGVSTGERIAEWYERVTPDTPQSKALVFMTGFIVVFIIGIGIFAPAFAASLTEDTEADSFVDDIQEGNYAGEVQRLFEGDAVRPDNETVSLRDTNDTDGDGIPDAWERAGETPDGVGLPGSSVGQMDLYVQIDTGGDIPELSQRERDALRDIWGDMPVENPDGTTGIALHLVESDIDGEIRALQPSAVDRYYTRENLRTRYCLYRHVVLGQLEARERIGLAESPGYAAIYDGSRFQGYDGEVPFRSAMITHALLHMVAGDVESQVHSEGGWMDYPSAENEQLSEAAASDIERGGFESTTRYQQTCGQNRSR